MLTNSAGAYASEAAPAGIQAQWLAFRDAGGEEYYRYWLAIQAQLVESALQGLLVMRASEDSSYAPVATWAVGDSNLERLTDICESVLEQRCGLLSELPSPCPGSQPKEKSYAIAYPVMLDDSLLGVVALEVVAGTEDGLAPVMSQLQWGIAWLELYHRRRSAREVSTSLEGLKSSFDLFAAILSETRAADACRVFVTEMATLMKCDRVSLGLMKNGHIRLKAISHSSQFGKNVSLVRAISNAMEESVLQKSELVYPRQDGMKALVVREHEELCRVQGGGAFLTMPLYWSGKYVGAVMLERPSAIPFLEEDASICRAISALAAPILEEKRLQDRLVILKVADSLSQQLARLLGAGYIGRKLLALLLLGVVLFFSLATGEYRLTADAVLEPSIRRSIVSPFNGYVKDAPARPGDVIKKGMPLCTLDGRDLYLDRTRLSNQVTQYQRQRQEAVATSDRAKVNIINAQINQVEAQLSLVQAQLKRTSLVAPYDGIVVSGDLSQRIDGAVEQGEVLFELAPLNAYRLILQVDEYRIADVQNGQTGTLVLPSLTDGDFGFSVAKITTLSSQKEGKNYFQVEGVLGKADDRMRPGMEGVGKIRIDRRKLIAIWSRDLVDWLRLKVWYWWP